MEFYDLLKLDSKGRTDVSRFFDIGSKLFFSYDSEEDVFVARRLFGTESVKPRWARAGEAVTVKKSGFISIPEWILEVVPGKVEKMLVSPVYSEAMTDAVSAVYLRPICEIELVLPEDRVTSERPREAINCPRAFKGSGELAEHMLQSAFGRDFDTTAGLEDTALSASTYVDDF